MGNGATEVEAIDDQFAEALDDDLNISAALGVLFETIRKTNRALDGGAITAEAAAGWLKWWERIDTVLALVTEPTALPAEIQALVEQRSQARLAKNWRRSDELRDELATRGWEVRDAKDGQKIARRTGV
jgi:cysteinyl-tRNA synthetase